MADTHDNVRQDTLDRITRKFTQEDRQYVQALVASVPGTSPVRTQDEAKITAGLQAMFHIAVLMLDELKTDNYLSLNPPSYDALHVKDLVAELRRALQGSGGPGFSGSGARAAVDAWFASEGAQAKKVFQVFLGRLVTQAKDRVAQEEARQQAAQQPVAETVEVRSNADILNDAVKEKLRLPVRTGDDRVGDVRSVLVVDGVKYHGSNGRGGDIDAVTRSVIVRFTDPQELWTLCGCAEASALSGYVTAKGFADADQVCQAFRRSGKGAVIGTVSLYEKNTPRASWDKRLPCNQCQQWLRALGIGVSTNGARS